MRWDQLCLRWTAVACFFAASPALAQIFTPINPPHPGEDDHATILSNIYGGTFVPSGGRGVDFSNGSLLAFRIDDRVDNTLFSGGALGMTGTGGEDETDQTWRADFVLAAAEAKFASFEQNFGYFSGVDDGIEAYTQLFALTGDRYNVQGQADLSALRGQLIRWGRGGQDRILSSRISDNADGEDHMVTYQLIDEQGPEGGEPLIRWLVFWEDILKGEPHEDFDFNDLVVEITAIPEPTALMGLGLAGLLALRRSRRA